LAYLSFKPISLLFMKARAGSTLHLPFQEKAGQSNNLSNLRWLLHWSLIKAIESMTAVVRQEKEKVLI